MEEFSYPVIVEGDWSSLNTNKVVHKLQIYFASKRKSGGGECVVQCSDRSASVVFTSEQTRKDVLAKGDHSVTIDSKTLKLKVYRPSDEAEPKTKDGNISDVRSVSQRQEVVSDEGQKKSTDESLEEPPNAVVLQNLPDHLNREYIGLLVESCDVPEDEFDVECIPELNSAVVTFNDPQAAEKFLPQSRTKKKFKDFGLKASFLEKCKSIKVENLPDQCNVDWAELYFDKHGEVEKVTMIPEEQSAIVTFKKHEDVKIILGKQLCVYNTKVDIYPFSESLGTALYGRNRPEWTLPESFTEKIHPAIREFLHKRGFITSIIKEMAQHYCQIIMDKLEVRFKPNPSLLRQKGVTKKQIDSWKQTTIDAFHTIISKFSIFEYSVDPSLWSEVEKDIRSTVKDKAVMEIDTSTGQLVLAGMTQDIKVLKPILEDFLNKATIQLEREKNKTKDNMIVPLAMYHLLQQEGLQQNTAVKHPQLEVTYKKDTNQLEFLGLPMEILYTKNWILEKQCKFKHKTLKMDPSILEFLRSVDLEEMSVDLFMVENINAVCRFEQGNLVLYGSSDQALNDAEKKLERMLTSKSLPLEDVDILEKTEWKNLTHQLHDKYNTSKTKRVLINSTKHSNAIIVSGFKDMVMEVSNVLGNFITKHSKIKEKVLVKSQAVVKFMKEKKPHDLQNFTMVTINFHPKRPLIEVSGERVHVQPALQFYQRLAKDLHTDRMIVNKPGAKKFFQEQGSMFFMIIRDYRFVVVLEEDVTEEEDDDETGNTAKEFEELSYEVRTPSGINIRVRQANMCQMKVDAVVNAANEDLKHSGGLALALLQAAGPSLQEISNTYVLVNGKLNPGEAVITEAGQLPCKYVVHAVGPRYHSNTKLESIRILRQAVRVSLNQASLNNCTSIAMPAISSGIFGFPLQLCTKTIANELCEYAKNQRGAINNLREIYLVDNNPITVRAMTQAVKNEFDDLNLKPTFQQQMESAYEGHSHSAAGHHDLRKQQKYDDRDTSRRSGNFESRVYRMDDDDDDDLTKQNYSRWTGLDRAKILESLSTQGVKIILQEGNIQDAQSDVIVNTVSSDLDLSHGAVSKALLQAAGPQIQREANANLAGLGSSLKQGDMVVTDGYNLKCQQVFHTVCPSWNGGGDQEVGVLKRIIKNCLQKAEQQKMGSISFPALGTGNLKFPKDLVCKILLNEIQVFSSSVTPQFLKEVTVIVHPSDKESVQCFIKEFKGGLKGPLTKGAKGGIVYQQPPVKKGQSTGLLGVVSSPTLGVHRVQVGNLTLEVSTGDITREKCDAVVNSSNQTFNLKSGVSKAILDAAGSSVEQECAQQAVLQQSNMIVTSGGQLLCKNIIHIIGQNKPADIKHVVYCVLKLCEEQKFTSVAFPALGTGQGGANVADVADAMIDAVVDFVKKKKVVVLQSVKFLIFQTHMVSDFHQSMLKKQQESDEEQSGVLSWIKGQADKVANLFGWGSSKDSSSNEEFVIVSEEIEPVVFQLCGESEQDLSEARKLIKSFILKENFTSNIQDSAINYFGQEESDKLRDLQRELSVSICLSKKGPEPEITVEGLSRDVVKVENQIRNMIRKVEKNRTRQREAFIIGSQVQWQYEDQTNNLVAFDLLTNYDLEEAFRMNKSDINISINNEEYKASTAHLKAVKKNIVIKLKRTEQKDQSSVSLPSHWDDMKGQLVITVQVQLGTPEYIEVEKEFRRTGLTSNILRIDRVQNETLWKNYINQKAHIERKNKHKNNEKRLFHGTGHQNIDKINHQGFNRSFAGTAVGAAYGNGVYFAVDPAYSAQGYAKQDQQGHKRMYLAQVLVGDSTVGKGGLLAPPAKSTKGTDLYDSVTDPRQTMFVIFHDVQAYPEYLITFQ